MLLEWPVVLFQYSRNLAHPAEHMLIVSVFNVLISLARNFDTLYVVIVELSSSTKSTTYIWATKICS